MKKRLWILVIVVMVIFLVSCGKNDNNIQDNGYPSKVTIGTIRVANDKTVSYHMGYMEDFFSQKGIDVDFVFFDSGTSANVAFASGDLDFATMGYTNGIVALDKGLNVELIWIHEILGASEALVVQKDGNINHIKELKGKVVATPFSSTSHYSLLKAIEDEGLHSTDMTILDMNTEDIIAAWGRGDLDGAYTWEPTLSVIKETGRVLVDSEKMANRGYMTANIELVNKDFSDKYPELVEGYLESLAKAVNLYNTDPDTAINSCSQHLEIDYEDAKKQVEGSRWLTANEQISSDYLGTEDSIGKFGDVFMDTAEFLYQEKKIGSVPSEEEIKGFINTSYVENIVK